MDNPSLILQTVDTHLRHKVKLVLYGRAALWLGFESPPPEAARTLDVDAIISLTQEAHFAQDLAFWAAIETANAELAAKGLYITHLFSEREVFLRKSWEEKVTVVARPRLNWLQLFRPATVDLVLTKMMRGNDPQDMADAEFMIRHDRIDEAQLRQAFEEMKPIEMADLRDAFARAKPTVLKIASQI